MRVLLITIMGFPGLWTLVRKVSSISVSEKVIILSISLSRWVRIGHHPLVLSPCGAGFPRYAFCSEGHCIGYGCLKDRIYKGVMVVGSLGQMSD